MKTFVVLTLVCFAGSASPAVCAGASPQARTPVVSIQLHKQASVSGATFTLGEVARITGPSQSIVSRVNAIGMGRSPYPGQSVSVSADEVRFRLRVAKVDPSHVSFREPFRAQIVRASQTVDPDRLAEAAKDAVEKAWQGTERVECEVMRRPQEAQVSQGALELAPQLSSSPRAGLFSVPVDIRVSGQKERSVSVSVNVKVFQPVVVTVKALARGQTIDPADLTIEERDLGGANGGTLADVALAAGQRTTRAVVAGAVLRQADIEVTPLVHRNGPVVITAVAGRVSIRSNGLALEEGQLGQLVKVRPDHSKESISAKVTGDGTVELAM